MSDSDSSQDFTVMSSDSSIAQEQQPMNCLKIRPSDDFSPIASLTPIEESDRYRMATGKNKTDFAVVAQGGRAAQPEISNAFATDLDYAIRNNINNDDLLYAPYPIKSMAPISFLEQLAQSVLHADILVKAEAVADDVHQQTALVTAFVAAFVGHVKKNVASHPFMPVLGETFEVFANSTRQWRFLAEQVEVDVTAISLKAQGFHFQQNLCLKSEFLGDRKLFTVDPSGAGHIAFEKTRNEVSWSLDDVRLTLTTLSGGASAQCTAIVDGAISVVNSRGDNARIVFQESDPTAHTAFHALVFSRENTKLIGLNGNFEESINGVFPAPKLRPQSVCSPIREPVTTSLLTMKLEKPEAQLKYSSSEIGELPPTDSRLRADVLYARRALKTDTPDEANVLFGKAQQKHEKYLRREYSRRIASSTQNFGAYQNYDNNNDNINGNLPPASATPLQDPLWFRRFIEGGHVRYRYVDGEAEEYWTARAQKNFSRCPDIFECLVKKKY
ncbi:hypothetical protein QR680_005127 [Steinernema hermaphroditum]|uniref:Uncharacterized protein n=1 Tax=Steinernema hermaphroditum TaxID=289476 RepID=A0AA39HT50_9BILA|nr:hypothetical protein QR680_005127 [Steinernema hermaphroditum]